MLNATWLGRIFLGGFAALFWRLAGNPIERREKQGKRRNGSKICRRHAHAVKHHGITRRHQKRRYENDIKRAIHGSNLCSTSAGNGRSPYRFPKSPSQSLWHRAANLAVARKLHRKNTWPDFPPMD